MALFVVFNSNCNDTVGAVAELPNVTQCVVGSIPARNKSLFVLQIVVPGLAVNVCEFSLFVNSPTIQELLPERSVEQV